MLAKVVLFLAALIGAAVASSSNMSLVLPLNLDPQQPLTDTHQSIFIDPKVPVTATVLAVSSQTTTYKLGCQNNGQCLVANIAPLTLTAGPTFYQHASTSVQSFAPGTTITEVMNQRCEFSDSKALTCTDSSVAPNWFLQLSGTGTLSSGAFSLTQPSTGSQPVKTLTGAELTTQAIKVVSGTQLLGSSATGAASNGMSSSGAASSTTKAAAAPTANAGNIAGVWAAAIAGVLPIL